MTLGHACTVQCAYRVCISIAIAMQNRLCYIPSSLLHDLAAIALYNHFVYPWVLCVQL